MLSVYILLMCVVSTYLRVEKYVNSQHILVMLIENAIPSQSQFLQGIFAVSHYFYINALCGRQG